VLDIRDLRVVPGADAALDAIANEGAPPDRDAGADAVADGPPPGEAGACDGRDAGGNAPASDPRQPGPITTLASTLKGPVGIAVDAERVLFAESGHNVFFNGRVGAIALAGGAITTAGSPHTNPWDLTIAGGVGYLARNFLFEPTQGGNLRSQLLGAAGSFASFGPAVSRAIQVSVANGRVYWAEETGIFSCSVTGCGVKPSVEAMLTEPAGGFFTDGTTLTWTVPATGLVEQCTAGSCAGTRHTVASGQKVPRRIVSDGTYLYWTNEGLANAAGSLMKSFVDGCGIVALATSLARPQALATDGVDVYFTATGTSPTFTDGAVLRCKIDGCGGLPVVLAAAQVEPLGIALDATTVYFTSYGQHGTTGTPNVATGTVATTPK